MFVVGNNNHVDINGLDTINIKIISCHLVVLLFRLTQFKIIDVDGMKKIIL